MSIIYLLMKISIFTSNAMSEFQDDFRCVTLKTNINESVDTQYERELEKEYMKTIRSKVQVPKSGPVKNPIRIKFLYTDAFNKISKADYFKTHVFEEAARRLSQSIGVKYPVNSPVRIPRLCQGIFIDPECMDKCNKVRLCIDVPVPEFMYARCLARDRNGGIIVYDEGPGMKNTDLVIIVDYRPKNCVGIASSAPCASGLKRRPTFGTIIVCSKIYFFIHERPEDIIGVFNHEIFHIMGFHSDLFYRFVDSKGNNIAQNTNEITSGIIKLVSRPRSSYYLNYTKSFFSFILPKSLNYVRKFFNCSDLEGVDMEDVESRRYSHFDELIYRTDLMSPLLNEPYLELTHLSLSFLEDTGWYHINYSRAVETDYGKNKGCVFAREGCYRYMNHQKDLNVSIEPYCDRFLYDKNKNMYCTKDRKYKQHCQLIDIGIKDSKYIYFGKVSGLSHEQAIKLTGEKIHSEYCPFLKITRRGSECARKDIKEDYKDVLNNYYGNDSKCFTTTINPRPLTFFYGAACFKYKDINDTHLGFYYKDNEHICEKEKRFIIQKVFVNITVDCTFKKPGIFPSISCANCIWNLHIIYRLIIVFVIQKYFINQSFNW